MDYHLTQVNNKIKWTPKPPATKEEIDRVLNHKKAVLFDKVGLESLRAFWGIYGGIEWFGHFFRGRILSPAEVLEGLDSKKRIWKSASFGNCFPIFDDGPKKNPLDATRRLGMTTDGRIVNVNIFDDLTPILGVVVAESFDQFILDLQTYKGLVVFYHSDQFSAEVSFDLVYNFPALMKYYERFFAMNKHPFGFRFRESVAKLSWTKAGQEVHLKLLEEFPRIPPEDKTLLELWEDAMGRLAILYRKQGHIEPAIEVEGLISDQVFFHRKDRQRIDPIENPPTVKDGGYAVLVKAGWALRYLHKNLSELARTNREYCDPEEIRAKCLRVVERYVGEGNMKGLNLNKN